MKSLWKVTMLLYMTFSGMFMNMHANETVNISVSGRQPYCPLDIIHIGSNFTISNPNSSGVQAFYIQISSGYQRNVDVLELTGDHPAINSEWDYVEGKLILTSAVGNIIRFPRLQEAVRDVVYRSYDNELTVEKFFSFSIGTASYLPSNGHYYEYVSQPGITWGAAKAAAESSTYFGLQGYLVTITSLDEAILVGEHALGTGWIAGSDQGTEGVWRWLSGPEFGTIFWNGTSAGSSPTFAYWNQGEPNNLGSEDYAHITDPTVGIPGSWNDLPFEGGDGLYEPQGYVVEYGGMPGDPDVNIAGSTSIYVPQIDYTVDGQICIEGSTLLTAVATSGQVNWYDQMTGGNLVGTGPVFQTPHLTENTTYYATVSVNGCTTSPRIPAEAIINVTPEVTSTWDDIVCVGNTAFIKATTDFGTIKWYESESSSTAVFTGSVFNTPEIFENTTYYAEADINGCTNGDRFPVTITVEDITPTFDLPDEVTICLDEGSVFVEAHNPGGNYLYQWRNEEGNLIGSAQGIPINTGGRYTVIALTTSGCESESKVIDVFESELNSFTSENITIDDSTVNNRIVIDARSLGVGTYEFSLNDPNGPYTTNPIMEQISPGLHTMYVRDVGGCGSLSYQFSVLDIPTFFTPNDDGLNDYWQLKGINSSFYTTAEINIYNRYGILVATVDPDSQGWNGVSKGWRLPSNDYWYSAKLVDINGVVTERKGHFSLLRR